MKDLAQYLGDLKFYYQPTRITDKIFRINWSWNSIFLFSYMIFLSFFSLSVWTANPDFWQLSGVCSILSNREFWSCTNVSITQILRLCDCYFLPGFFAISSLVEIAFFFMLWNILLLLISYFIKDFSKVEHECRKYFER